MKPLVPDFILEQFLHGNYRGTFDAVVACVDISGFTHLTETLFHYRQDGAEILGETLGSIFGPLVSAVYQAGGFIPLYGGDSFTAIFPPDSNNELGQETISRVLKTAEAIKNHLMPNGEPRLFQTPYGTFSISVKVGLAAGQVRWGIVGQDGLRSFYFGGPAILAAAQAQLNAEPGQIVVDKLEHLGTDYTNRDIGAKPRPELSAHIPAFISPSILSLPTQAEFRYACPVFISVKMPVETTDLEQFILDTMQLTHHYGGFFSQVEFGDKGLILLLHFGAPISHENNALRAARCLSNLRQASLVSNPLPLTWRAGLTSGLVWAGFRGGEERLEYGIIGDVVNSAAHLSQIAKWGEIWVDDQAAAQLEGEYECGYVGRRQLKGEQSAKTVYRLMGPQLKLNITHQGPMVGRREELRLLQEAIEPIFHGRFGGVFSVYGEAGMGKSRLLFELKREIGPAVNWLICPADEVLRQSLNPFRYYLNSYFQENNGNSQLDRQGFVKEIEYITGRLDSLDDGRAAGISAEVQRTRPFLADFLNINWPDSLYNQLEPRLRFENTLAALTSFLQSKAIMQPIVIQLEDFHWFDLDSRQFLEQLCEKLETYPAIFFITSRYSEDGTLPGLALSPSVPQRTIQLENLDRSGIRLLAEEQLEGPVHSELLDFLVEKSGGRPFFAEQLLLELSDQMAVEKQGDQFALVVEKTGTIPTSLNTLLISRLDNLQASVKRVVQTAAILGERFLVPVLHTILSQENTLPDILKEASQQRIWVLQDELRYMFKHALLRDAAYSMQPQSRRRELHYLAATSLETFYQDNISPSYHEIAYHYEQAYAQGLEQVRGQATHYLALTAKRAVEKYELDTAVEFADKALAILPAAKIEERYDLLLLKEKAYNLRGKIAAWQSVIEELAALVGLSLQGEMVESKRPYPLRNPSKKAEVAYLCARFNQFRGQSELALLQIAQSQALYRKGKNQKGAAASLAFEGGIHWDRGGFEKASKCLNEAAAIFSTLNLPENVAFCFNILGIIEADLGRYLNALNYYNEALRLVGESQIEQNLIISSNLAEVACWLGLYDQAQVHIERALRLSRQIGNRHRQPMFLLNMGIISIDTGNWELAQHYLNRALAISREIGNRREEGTILHNLGYAAVFEGNLDAAVSYLEKALRIRQQLERGHFVVEDQAALAWVYHQQGQAERARHHLHETTSYLKENPSLFGAYKPLMVYWRIYSVAKDVAPKLSEELLETAQALIRERAAMIDDPNIRDAYLTKVPENKFLLLS